MGGEKKLRSTSSMDSNAREVIKKVHEIYKEKDGSSSLLSMATDLDLVDEIHAPRRKVSVMIIGNHSAGKSSFINWYISEDVQNTGVAIETQGFTFVTYGGKKTLAPIKGESSVMLFPYLKQMKSTYGKPFVDNLSTVVSTSSVRSNFRLVDLIDTPGLVDGNVSYPMDVNKTIVDLASHVDLIFVFLDPMGQALCSRTMEVVKALNSCSISSEKIKYFLTKADTIASNPTDLMKLMVQITQNIKENIQNTHGLEIPTIWLPSKTPKEDFNNLNQINKLEEMIQVAIHQKVQDNLSHLEKDCTALLSVIRSALKHDAAQKEAKSFRESFGYVCWIISQIIPIITSMILISLMQFYLPPSVQEIGSEFFEATRLILPNHQIVSQVIKSVIFVTSVSIILYSVFSKLHVAMVKHCLQFKTKPQEVIDRYKSYEGQIALILSTREKLFSDYVHTYTYCDDDESESDVTSEDYETFMANLEESSM